MSDEIAIVGAGCRFPGADNLEEFWRVLVQGENHIREVDNERWDFNRYYDPDINAEGKSYVNKAGLLRNIDKWDNQLFGVSDNEAKVVDPQQRLVLDCCHMAMEDAGISRKRLDGSQTAVYVGAMNDDFSGRKTNFTAADSAYCVTGIFRSILSARISYTFNLKGPCMVVDTACSSSLVAIHLACQSLKTKESELCFAGGVSVLLDPWNFVFLSKAHMLSPTGQCQTFTADADGYVRGEGCGMVILQRLEDAIREGNNIWGIIRTGTNQDGRMISPMTAPSGVQQLELLRKIYDNQGADRNDVQFIEAHGTGTPIGDPTEVNSLGEFFKDSETAKRDKILIGSVKTNIGHLESAAGVAGLIKVMLMMRHERIVPSVMYTEEKRNPKLDFGEFDMVIPTNVFNWEKGSGKTRVACVNSFGFGGSNAHLIIKQWLPKSEHVVENGYLEMDNQKLFLLSSLDKFGIVKNLKQFRDDLEISSSTLTEISMTSLYRRDHFIYRAALIARSKEELGQQCLNAIKRLQNRNQPGALRIVYVFCGVGTTWKGMCFELLQNQIFRTAVMSVDQRLQKYTGWSITDKWKNRDDISDPFVSHLSIFVCQIGLTAIWKAVGIIPDTVVGQSVGEVAACYAAEIIDEGSAVKIIYQRSLLLSQCESGGMIVVRNVNVGEVETLCNKIGNLNIAVYISPIACTVAGKRTAIVRLESCLREEPNVILKTLDLPCGYHSPMVEAAGNGLQSSLEGTIKEEKRTSGIRMISSVFGREIDSGEYSKPSYWKDNVNRPVKFHNAVSQALSKKKTTVFIEIGPSSVLKAHSLDIFGKIQNYEVVPSVRMGKELSTLLQAFASVYEMGCDIDFSNLEKNTNKIRPALIPRYVFNQKLFVLPKECKQQQEVDHKYDVQSKQVHNYISIKDKSDSDVLLEIHISPQTTPYVYQHFVRETVIVPGALYADVGFEIGKKLLNLQPDEINVTLDFLNAVTLDAEETLFMKVSVKEKMYENKHQYSFVVYNNSVAVCKGIVREMNDVTQANHFNLSSLHFDLQDKVSGNDLYATLQKAGFRYGSQLTVLREGLRNPSMCLIEMAFSDEVITDFNKCHIHPCILDGMLQTTVIFSHEGNNSTNSSAEPLQFLPVGMDCIRISKKCLQISLNTTLKVLAEKVSYASLETMKKHHFNIYLLDGCGFILAEIKNFTMYAANRQLKSCDDLRYTLSWTKVQNENGNAYPSVSERNVCDRKVILINASYAVSTFFKASEFIVEFLCSRGDFKDINGKHFDEKINGCSSIVVFFTPDTNVPDTDQSVFDAISGNFKFLQGLVLQLMKQNVNFPELFLVTQGVHSEHYPENHVKDTSLIGSEIWGLFRNLEIEFVYRKITMIDMDSMSQHSLQTLLDVMRSSENNQQPKGREFIINGKDIYEAHIRPTSKRYKMPMLRCHDKPYKSCSSNYVLYSSKRYLVDEPYLVYTDTREVGWSISGYPSTEFEVERICIHDSNLYPLTEFTLSGNFNLHTEKKEKSGYKVIAIEMIGRKLSQANQYKSSDNEDNDLYVAIFPTVASHFIQVPEACCFKLKEVQNYTPGLVLTTVLLFRILKDIPSDSSVYVVSSDISVETQNLLQAILQAQRACFVVHRIEIETRINVDSRNKSVAIVLQNVDDVGAFDFLKQFEFVFGFSFCISDSLKDNLAKCERTNFKLVDPKFFIESKELVETVKEVQSLLLNFKPRRSSEEPINYKRVFGSPFRTIQCHSRNIEAVSQCKVRVSQNNLFDKMATYIVVGGLTGVGWFIVELLAEKGAGVIITFGRRTASSGITKKCRNLEETFKCKVIHYELSVTDASKLSSTIVDIETNFLDHPIRGIFQGAGVIKAATIEDLTDVQIDDVLLPKVLGTLNLFNATKHLNLDYFVLLSSLSSVIGVVGHTNYGAANSFLDAFADNRRQHGYRVQSINWGAISSGMAAVESVARDFEVLGHLLLKREEFRSCFIHSLMTNESNVIYANLDYDKFLTFYDMPDLIYHAKKYEFLWEHKYMLGRVENDNTNKRFDKDTIKGQELHEQVKIVEDLLKQFCSAAATFSFEEYDLQEPFVAMGLDSLATITISSLIRSSFGVTVKSETMLEPRSTISKLATKIVNEMNRKD